VAPIITVAVLCRRVSSDHEGFTLHGIADAVTLLDEEGPLNIFGMVWVFPDESGPYSVRALVVAPSGEIASNQYEMTVKLQAGVPAKWNFEFEVEAQEEGLYWFLAQVGPETEARFPMGVRWAPDSAQARRRRQPD
jgi:hypothetical protein